MAELADAYGSGPYESNFMQVQVLLPAPNKNNPNLTPMEMGSDYFLDFILSFVYWFVKVIKIDKYLFFIFYSIFYRHSCLHNYN